MEKRETPWAALLACAFPALLVGMALISREWGAALIFAILAAPPCVALVYVLYLHDELAYELSDALLKANEALKPATLPKPVVATPPPAQQAERNEVILGEMESVKNHAARKAAPVAVPEPATTPVAEMTILDEPPPQEEAPPKIQPAPSADLDGAKYLPHTGNPPKLKFLHCDQTIQATYPKALRHSGFNASVTKGSDVTEEAQLDMAHEECRVLVSTNVDYEILAAHGRKHAGILIVPRGAKPETILGACRKIWSKVPHGRKRRRRRSMRRIRVLVRPRAISSWPGPSSPHRRRRAAS